MRCSTLSVQFPAIARMFLLAITLQISFAFVSAQDTDSPEALMFISNRDGQPDVYVMQQDGSYLHRWLTTAFEPGGRLQEAVLSPSGNYLAFTSSQLHSIYGTREVFLLDMTTGIIQPTPYTTGYDNDSPTWSPDGSRLAYLSNGAVGYYQQVIIFDPVSGQSQIVVDDATLSEIVGDGARFLGLDWAPDGQHIVVSVQTAAPDSYRVLVVIDADGSHPQQVTPNTLKASLPAWRWQSIFVYFVCRDSYDQLDNICSVDIQTGAIQTLTNWPVLMPDNPYPQIQAIRVSRSGQFVLALGGEFYRFYPQYRTVDNLTPGIHAPNLAPVWISQSLSAVPYAALLDHAIMFVSDRAGQPDVYVMRSDGTDVRRFVNSPFEEGGTLVQAALSPTGRFLAFSSVAARGGDGYGVAAVFVLDMATGDIQALPRSQDPYERSDTPRWSPDGSRVAYLSDGGVAGYGRLMIADMVTGQRWSVTDSRTLLYAVNARLAITGFDWSPDGEQIIFSGQTGLPNAYSVLIAVNIDGSHPQQLTPTGLNAAFPNWRWLRNSIQFMCLIDRTPEICSLDPQDHSFERLTNLRYLRQNAGDSSETLQSGFDGTTNGKFLLQFGAHLDIYVYNALDGSLVNVTQGSGGTVSYPTWIPFSEPMTTNS